MQQYRKSFILFLSLCFIIFSLERCISKSESVPDARGKGYVGSSSCRQCHAEIYDRYLKSNHYKASAQADKKSVVANFNKGTNTFHFEGGNKIVMEDRDSGLYQVVYQNEKEQEAYRLDLVFGAKHAQTYLYWKDNRTFELPISYYTSVNSWATSPGFSPKEINFNRFIGLDCFECHSSYIKTELDASTAGITEVLNKNSLITGIDCERCHGPAVNHVNYHEAYPDVQQAKYIVINKDLSRQQKLDACAVCHSGNDKIKQISRFDFRPGDTLAHFFFPGSNKNNAKADVHGNQYQLLAESGCFIKSNSLNCSTCHNPHTNANEGIKAYSKKCISCHESTDHSALTMNEVKSNTINDNCIDCHMPFQSSDAITFNLENTTKKTSYMLRTHKIAIYSKSEDVVRNFVQYFKTNKGG